MKIPPSHSKRRQLTDNTPPKQDLTLQRAAISRLARGVLPPNTSLQKDAIHAIAKSATVFISYLASHANEQRPSAKTITPGDVLNALREIELAQVMQVGEVDTETGEATGRLEREMKVFEEVIRGKRRGYRDKVKARESVGGGDGGETAEGGEVEGEGEGSAAGIERGEPETKRARRTSGEDEPRGGDEARDDEDALLDAQLNGAGMETEPEEEEEEEEADEEDEAGDEEDEEQEPADEDDEEIDRVDVEDEPSAGRRVSSRSTKGRHSMLSPNGRMDLESDDSD